MLETRFAITIVGTVIDDPLTSAIAVAGMTLGLLMAQAVSKPFLQTPEQEAHWSSANKMALIIYACTLAFLLVGLVSILNDPVGDGLGYLLSLLAMIALFIPVILTVRIAQGVDVGSGDYSDGTRVITQNPVREDASTE